MPLTKVELDYKKEVQAKNVRMGGLVERIAKIRRELWTDQEQIAIQKLREAEMWLLNWNK